MKDKKQPEPKKEYPEAKANAQSKEGNRKMVMKLSVKRK